MAEDIRDTIARLNKRLADHERHTQNEFKAGNDKFTQIMEGIETLGDKVDTCVDEICELKANTAGVVQVYEDITGAGRTLTRLQSIALKLLMWVGIPSSVYMALKAFLSRLPPSL